jgi:hypothetical protein
LILKLALATPDNPEWVRGMDTVSPQHILPAESVAKRTIPVWADTRLPQRIAIRKITNGVNVLITKLYSKIRNVHPSEFSPSGQPRFKI